MNLERTITMLLVSGTVLMSAACSGAGGASDISVSDARVPVPAGANGAAYMTLTNNGDVEDTLVGVSTDIAETAELHETSTQGGSMSMQPVDGVDIPADSHAVLEPGGLHVMLIGVTGDLAEGDTVDLTLTFKDAGALTVSAEVVPLGDMPGMDTGSEATATGS